jgi:endonuclease/exonuclease/phosphatase (EEP) superfamily protein YafD
MVTLALYSLGCLAIVATLLPLFRKGAWWIRIFDFPRVQIALVALAVLLADLIVFTDPGAGAIAFRFVLLACVIYQLYMIYPYTFLVPRIVKPAQAPRHDRTIRLVISNVKIENRNAPALLNIVRNNDPDVLLVLEPDQWWRDSLSELESSYPFTVQKPLDNSYGMILYSRLEILQHEILFRLYDDIPSIRARVALPSGVEVELHCLHPKPPVPQEEASSEQRDAELLLVARETRGKNIPIIVMGDLNDVAWSHTNYLFQRISGLLDPRIGRGFYNTFDARYWIMRFPLDHFFHSNHFRLIELRRLPYYGSDHFPMFIALSYEPDATAEQKPATPDAGDQQEATEKIEKATTDS